MTKKQMQIEQQTLEEANYIIENKTTVRNAAKHFGVSKSAIHTRLTNQLKNISFLTFNEVRSILEINKNERHIRGGIATRKKYMVVN